MELKIALLAVLLLVLLAVHSSDGGYYRKKKIIIHIPVKQNSHKHVHTKVKSIHHHHKPLVIKEEKVIKHEYKSKPIKVIEDVSHDHFHHHYKHHHPTLVELGHDNQEYSAHSHVHHEIKHPKKHTFSDGSGGFGSFDSGSQRIGGSSEGF